MVKDAGTTVKDETTGTVFETVVESTMVSKWFANESG